MFFPGWANGLPSVIMQEDIEQVIKLLLGTPID